MAGLDDLISQIPIDELSKKLGVDPSTATEAVHKALPALLSGMHANAKAGGAESLEKAVKSHDSALVDGGVNLDEVNAEDGKKIVKHVFGGSEDKVASALGNAGGNKGGGLGDVIGKALPVLAPIVMSYLAQRTKKGQTSSNAPQEQGGLGGILGGLLGGGSNGGGGLGDLLGGLLGGGRK